MKKMQHFSKKLFRVSAVLFLCAIFFATSVHAESVTDREAVPSVIEKTTSSVVAIIGKPSNSKNVREMDRYQLAHGTGVVIKKEGYILTNAHVVKNMHNITVVTSDGKSFPGKTTHYDEESDLALVKIEATGLTPATFAEQKDIRVGEPVIAIGTPISFALRNSVSYGIVSGMQRSVESKYQLIQTDAAINPGNSGGALVNMKGQVIGINTMKYVNYGVDSLGFAIPVDTVQYVLDHFFKYGKVKRPYLGMELGESWEAVVGLPSGNGLEVTYVDPDSPAAKAGIKQGDVLLSIDGAKTHNLVEYNEAIKKYLPEQKIKLSLQIGASQKDIEVELGEERSSGSTLVQDADGSYIDADQGKTKIGDSHYGWSMKYPAGLVKTSQSPDGNSIMFADAKGQFAISIRIQDKQSQDLSPLGLLKKLSGKAAETILEKQYVEKAVYPYAKIAGQKEMGGYYQIRAFLKEDKIYYVTLAVSSKDDEQDNNMSKRNSYLDLLDTFTLSFDANDSSLKDISVYQKKNTIESEYGFTFDLPSEWSEDWGGGLTFSSKDGEQTLSVQVSSATSGDTLKDWAARQERKFLDSFVEGYREVQGAKETTIDGVPAVENRYSATMGDKWQQTHVIYIIKDKYTYKFKFSFSKDSDNAEIAGLINTLKNSIHFPKDSLNHSLGFIQDEDDLFDKNKTATYTNKKHHYSIRVPENWLGENWLGGYDSEYESTMKMFMFTGGSLSIKADDRSGLDEVVSKVEKEYKTNAETDTNYKYQMTEEQMYGTTVKKFFTQYKSKNVPYTQSEYVFEKNGTIYTISARINDAVKTEEQWQRLEQAIQSMSFLEK